MTVFELTCTNPTTGKTVTTLFTSREIAESSIRLSFHKVPEPERSQRIAEIKICEVHVHDRTTHL